MTNSPPLHQGDPYAYSYGPASTAAERHCESFAIAYGYLHGLLQTTEFTSDNLFEIQGISFA